MKQKRVMQIFLPSDANIFADLVTLPSSSQMPCWPVEIGALVWLANEVSTLYIFIRYLCQQRIETQKCR